MIAIGDLANSLFLKHRQAALKADISKFSTELTTGRVADVAEHLGGHINHIEDLRSQLEKISAFKQVTKELQIRTSDTQAALSRIRNTLADLAIPAVSQDLNASDMQNGLERADVVQALEETLRTLNIKSSGKFLFSGKDSERRPFSEPDAFQAAVKASISGLSDPVDIISEMETFFSPGGDYETAIYKGASDGKLAFSVSENEQVNFALSGETLEIRNSLKALALALIANDPSVSLSRTDRQFLTNRSGLELSSAEDGLITAEAGIGQITAQLDENFSALERETAQASINIDGLVGVDEYDTAMRLESSKNQLESLYAVVARKSRLSFLEFLR